MSICYFIIILTFGYSGRVTNPSWAMSSAILSECGTVQLEFSSLSKHTGDPIFREKVYIYYIIFRLPSLCIPFTGGNVFLGYENVR